MMKLLKFGSLNFYCSLGAFINFEMMTQLLILHDFIADVLDLAQKILQFKNLCLFEEVRVNDFYFLCENKIYRFKLLKYLFFYCSCLVIFL